MPAPSSPALPRRQIDRRSLLLTLAATAAAPRLALGRSGRSLLSFGARGDGISDDTAAIARAVASGVSVDGGGRTYGISGPLSAGPAFRGLSNCTLRQLARIDRLRTLEIRGASGFAMADVQVIRGGQNDEVLIQRDMQSNAGLWIEDCSAFHLDRVRVRGGGIGTGLVIASCRGFQVADAQVSGIRYQLKARPRDDMLQGIWINRCSGFELIRPVAGDLGGQDEQGFSRDNNRAIAISGSSIFRVRDPQVSQCGQGLDVTGSEGDHDFQIVGGHASDCATWGFKLANSAQRVRVSGALAERCGLGGFVASGPSEGTDPLPVDLEFADCRAIDCGTPKVDRTMFGFGVLRSSTHPDYPRRVRFLRCTAIDRRRPAGMKWGFFNEIPETPGELNTVEGCSVSGPRISDYEGFGR